MSVSVVSLGPASPPASFPEQMAALRCGRGLSLRGLARLANVSHDALGAWERGERLPRLPELEAALAALDVSPAERLCLIALLPAPHALRHVRTAAETTGPLPGGGDLLRAMRGRRGLTQTDAARAAGVSQGRLARWEQSEDWPTNERLHALCRALEAHPAETEALTGGRGALPDWDEAEDAEAWAYRGAASSQDPLGRLIKRTYFHSGVLRDLRSLSLERALRLRAQGDEAFLPHLHDAYCYRARAMMEEGRLAEVGAYADRTWEMARQGHGRSEFWVWGMIASAAVLSRGSVGRRPRPDSAATLLAPIVALVPPGENLAWMLSELAIAMARAGRAEEALRASAQALELARRAPDPSELWFRRRDQASLLCALRHPEEALDVLENSAGLFHHGADPIVRHHLLAAECHLNLGNADAAQERLLPALALIEWHSGHGKAYLTGLRPQANALLARL